MNLPVEFEHEIESGAIARVKQYEIKAHKFVVDVAEDAEAFVELGYRVVREDVKVAEDKPKAPNRKVADAKVDA